MFGVIFVCVLRLRVRKERVKNDRVDLLLKFLDVIKICNLKGMWFLLLNCDCGCFILVLVWVIVFRLYVVGVKLEAWVVLEGKIVGVVVRFG